MGLRVVSAPATRPIMLEEAKGHLRVDFNDEDALIDALISVATEWAETETNRALITQTLELTLEGFPWEIELSKPPLQSITSISYIDSQGVSQTLDASTYQMDSTGVFGRVKPVHGETWPSVQVGTYNAVTVRYVAGYGAKGDVPEPIIQGMLLAIGEMYERREDAVVGTIINQVSFNARALLLPYRAWTF